MRFIDISENQGEVDLDAVAAQCDGVLVRCSGYGWERADYQFYRNRDGFR